MWCEPATTRVVWITMMAMCDRSGRVWGSIPGLANRSQVTVAETETALACFLAPDRYSRTTDHEGRRIEAMDGGWRLLNYQKYRDIRDEEERREYKRKKQREYRSVDNVDKCGPPSNDVDHGAHNAEAEAEAEKKDKRPRARRAPLPENFSITDSMRKWADRETPTVDIELATRQFIDHHRGKGNTFADPIAGWRTWMRNCVTYGRPLKSGGALRERL